MAKKKGLNFKSFKTPEELQTWTNSEYGTEYIISIHKNEANGTWIIWYIID